MDARFLSLAVAAASLGVTGLANAQRATSATVHGIIERQNSTPLDGANVFLLETLDGMVTHADGHFSIPLRDSTRITLIARHVGYEPIRRKLTGNELTHDVIVVMKPVPQALGAVNVQAGRYSASNEREATLTSLDVVTTPGATADVNRAIQTLPGVQQVDEGTALFVRGGDYTETKVFLDDAVVLNPTDLQTPNGTFMGTVDPFLLDGIVFSSGGFGARYGNALSGVVALHTQGAPVKPAVTASAGLAALSASVAMPLSHDVGAWGAANLFNLRPFMRLNGSSQHYSPPPTGHDLSGSVIWKSHAAGELRVFGIDQTSTLGVGVEDPSYSGTYADSERSDLLVANWHASYGRFTPTVSASTAFTNRAERFGVFDLATRLRQQQVFSQLEWAASPRIILRAGGEIERTRAGFDGSVPAQSSDEAPGARLRVLASNGRGVRSALFGEGDLRLGEHTRLVLGLRTDSSSLTHQRTFDPRISAAVRPLTGLTLTAAWGEYHEVPDPSLFDPTLGDTALRSMRAVHSILGVQLGDGPRIARVELYDKRYSDLAQQDRNYVTVAGGRGFARGIDIFLKGDGPFGTTGRLTYSHLLSRRTDPNTGIVADAPFDIPNTVTLIVQQHLPHGIGLGAAYRYATGRPLTPVIGAARDSAEQRWIPEYGSSMSERIPAFERVDLSISQMHQLAPGWLGLLYADINNVLGRRNIYDYSYSSDYSRRVPVNSLFNRSLYFGASIIH